MDIPNPPNKAKRNPIHKASFLSRLLFFWFWPIFKLGHGKTLEREDLWDPPDEDQAQANADFLERNWSLKVTNAGNEARAEEGEAFLESKSGPPTQGCKLLLRALLATFGSRYFSVWPLILFNDCFLRVIQPWFMLCLIRTFVEEPVDETAQYIFAAGVCLSTFLLTLMNNPVQFYMGRLGQRCRISTASLIQRKAMTLSASSGSTDEGTITNLISNDAAYIENNIMIIPYLLVAPVQLSIFMVLLWFEFGVSSLFGVAFILLYMPFQYWNGSLSSIYRKKIGEKTDERVRALEEVIDAIHSIKMYTWELVFKEKLQRLRKLEVRKLKKRSRLHAFQMSIFLTSSRLVPFLTFIFFVFFGGPLTADRVFFALAVYNTATHFMVFMLPGAIRGIGEVKGSLERIQKFLLLEESPKNLANHTSRIPTDENILARIHLNHVSASWKKSESNVLEDISCDLSDSKLVLVVGKVGCAKTSLLHLILNELFISSGNVEITGSISYASQEPFLFDGSIRDNILFHNEYDKTRYNYVLSATALNDDIQALRNGDKTKVDHLSGGQKARVSLARAIYHKADIYLLDNSLAAVDTRVSRQIFDSLKELRKLTVLVTHQLQYLREADHVIVMKEGRIEDQGTFNEVQEAIERLGGQNNEAIDVDGILHQNGPINVSSNAGTAEKNGPDDDDREGMSEGALGLGIYWKYFKSGKSQLQLWIYFLIFLIAQFFTTMIELWLSNWTNAEEKIYEEFQARNASSLSEIEPQMEEKLNITTLDDFLMNINNLNGLMQQTYLIGYVILTFLVFLTNLAKAVAFFHYCMRICINIHRKMLECLLRAQPSFFDNNPSGRILNRFTKDMSEIDEKIPFAFFDMFTIFLQVATVIILIILAIWYSFVAVILFLLALWYVRGFYVTTSRDLMRITGTTRSPVISHMQATFRGLVTVRAMGAQKALFGKFDSLQDENTSATISYLAATQCFNIWIESLSTLLLTVVAFGFLIAQNYFEATFLGGNVGLAISSALSLTIWLQYGIIVSAKVENAMISVERAVEYTKLPLEAPLETDPDNRPDRQWPRDSCVKFEKVQFSYNGTNDILRGITFDIRPREKIGIVGRTGAGKSSTLWALLRMYELRGGRISIGNIDVANLGLHDLRKNIAVIPQTAKLFKETLKFNLDPTGKLTSTEAMLSALRLIGLNKSLDFQLENKGQNLCIGERQLVSLARAILLRRFLVCMDEATAHIDSATDQLIQQTFRDQLRDCSVITIAHRLGTVIDCDRILVLNEGVVVEYDHPHTLLQNDDGFLTNMVNHTGNDAENLRRRAESAFLRSNASRLPNGTI